MSFKEFWQRYRGEIGKLLVTHVAIAVFSIMCSSPLFVTDIQSLDSMLAIFILVTVFIFAFYYYLIRSQLWTLGAKNKISADGGRMKLCPLAGFYMGLIAAIPGLILDIVFIVSVIFVDNGGVSSVLSACAWLEFLWNAPVAALYIVTQIPYLYLASTLLPVLFAGIAYYCGTKEFAIFGIPQKKR